MKFKINTTETQVRLQNHEAKVSNCLDAKETLSLQQCENMIKNYIATGSGK